MRSPSLSPGPGPAVLALALVLLSNAAVAKPPPPPGAPWAPYAASKPGMAMRRSPLEAEPEEPAAAPEADSPFTGFGPGFGPPGLIFNPLFGSPGSPLFLKLKPAKPTFVPPVVDPTKFIEMKTSLLNSLFPAATAPGGGGAANPAPSLVSRALFSPFAAPTASDDSLSDALGPSPVVKPPPPAYLADLFKALNINKTVANASDTTPPISSPFAPVPVVDPGLIISKKAKFLSDLFASLSTTTPPPPTSTAAPSSIVPPDFWLPSGSSAGLVDPATYAEKVSAFLDRLFDSLNISQSSPGKRSAVDSSSTMQMMFDEPEDEMTAISNARTKRSTTSGATAPAPAPSDPATLLADAKDKVVDTIIGELAVLKNSMVGAVSDLAEAQKASTAATVPPAKKPSAPGMSPFAAMWAKPKPSSKMASVATPAPTSAPVLIEPLLQRVSVLGQVFDMLTDMEKDITSAMVIPTGSSLPAVSDTTDAAAHVDLMDAVKAKIDEMLAQNVSDVQKNRTAAAAPKVARLVGAPPPAEGTPLDPTFWIPDSVAIGPDAYLAKTKEFLDNIIAAKATTPTPLTRRSYKWYEAQQQGKKINEEKNQQPLQEQSNTPSSSQDIFKNLKDPLWQFYGDHHHHHHQNRQPYWWN